MVALKVCVWKGLPHCVTGAWLCAGRGVNQKPAILMGAVLVLSFSSVVVLQANSEERAALPAVGLSPLLPVLLLSVACGC